MAMPLSSRSRVLNAASIPITAFLLAWATSSVRADLGVANVALGLAVLTTIAALLSWPAGVVTSVVSALSLNYFHTEPVHSLRIGSASDTVMVALLATIGVSVSTSTAVRVRRRLIAREQQTEGDARKTLVDLLADSVPASTAWHSAIDAGDHAIRLTELQLEPRDGQSRPTIARPARQPIDDADHNATFVLPESGATIEFVDPRIPYRLSIAPTRGTGPLTVDRRTIFRLADDIESVLRHVEAD